MSSFLTLVQIADLESPPVAMFSGEGVGSVGLASISGQEAFFAGEGVGDATMTAASVTVLGDGEGVGTATGERVIVAEMRLSLLNDTVAQPPGAVDAVVGGAWPQTEVVFQVDGVEVMRATSDADGAVGPVSIPVASTTAVGSHTITVMSAGTDPATDATGTFTVTQAAAMAPAPVAADAPAVIVPDTGVRWVFQDPAPGGLGSWVMPQNPTSMSNPHLDRVLTAQPTTAVEGSFHVFETGLSPIEWTFEGVCPTQEMYDQLRAYENVKRRIYIIDHRQRAWQVVIVGLDMVPRKRTNYNDALTDWVHDYTMRVLILDQQWTVPS